MIPLVKTEKINRLLFYQNRYIETNDGVPIIQFFIFTPALLISPLYIPGLPRINANRLSSFELASITGDDDINRMIAGIFLD